MNRFDPPESQPAAIRSRTWIIADTHFGHRLMAQARGYVSVRDHDEDLIKRWNSVVCSKDVVWHLGDVLFGTQGFALLARLQGTKKLIMGNHDRYPVERYAEHFSKVHGVAQVGQCVFSHCPVVKQSYRFKANVHGHMHERRIRDPWYVCVSCEQQDCTPRLLSDVLKEIARERRGRYEMES